MSCNFLRDCLLGLARRPLAPALGTSASERWRFTINRMGKYEKLLIRILRGTSDANISFEALCQLMRNFGFDERIRGSHHIFTKEGVEEILNFQPIKSKAKAYQVKQARYVILKYKLGGEPNE